MDRNEELELLRDVARSISSIENMKNKAAIMKKDRESSVDANVHGEQKKIKKRRVEMSSSSLTSSFDAKGSRMIKQEVVNETNGGGSPNTSNNLSPVFDPSKVRVKIEMDYPPYW